MQKVVVNFDKGELQKTVDFYLSVVSPSNIKSQEDYRKSLYREFIKSSLNQLTSNVGEGGCESSCPLSSEDTTDSESKNVGVEIQDDFDFELGTEIERENTNLENQNEYGAGVPFDLNEESTDLENQNVVEGTFIDDLNEESADLENQEVVEGVFIDGLNDETYNLENEMDVVGSSVEYKPNGVFIEDVGDAYEEPIIPSNVEYCENGVFIEDIELEEYAEEAATEGYSYTVEGDGEGVEYEDESYEGDSGVEYNEEPEDEGYDGDSGIEYGEEPEDKGIEEIEYNDYGDSVEYIEDSSEGTEEVEYDDYDEDFGEVVEEPVHEDASPSHERPVVESTVKQKDTAMEVPSDIRVFLKKNPNSDIDFVLKYYSKKDIEKALKLGRIYKKRGKLVV